MTGFSVVFVSVGGKLILFLIITDAPSTCPECRITFFNAAHLKYHQLFLSLDEVTDNDGLIADFESSDAESKFRTRFTV